MFPVKCALTNDECVLLKSLDCDDITHCIDILIQLERVSSENDDFYHLVHSLILKLEKEQNDTLI